MQATVLQERAFGFLEAGESVLWASVPVLQGSPRCSKCLNSQDTRHTRSSSSGGA